MPIGCSRPWGVHKSDGFYRCLERPARGELEHYLGALPGFHMPQHVLVDAHCQPDVFLVDVVYPAAQRQLRALTPVPRPQTTEVW